MEITLIRHGKPMFELKGKAKARDVGEIISRYDLSGIVDKPPEHARQRASVCHVAVCSDLIRSLESARALGFVDILLSDQVFREIAIPHFKTGSLTMPVGLTYESLGLLTNFNAAVIKCWSSGLNNELGLRQLLYAGNRRHGLRPE